MTSSTLPTIDLNSLGPVRLSRRQNLAPCELRVLEVIERLAEVKAKNPKEWWPTLRAAALADYWVYLRLVLDYRFLDPWDHGEEVVPFFQDCVDDNEPGLILAPRGGAKTGVISTPATPWLIARDPTITTIITNVRESKASEFARNASRIITECAFYRQAFPDVQPTDKWGEGGYYVKQTAQNYGGALGRVDPSIGSYGVGGNIVGSHVRAIIHDDLINDKTYNSPVERAKAEAFLKESLNCLDPGGLFMCCATRWHFDDVYGKLENGEIIIDGKRVKVFCRGAERYVEDDDGNAVVEIFNPRRTYVDMHGRQLQVGYTPEMLKGFKQNLGSLYSALYMNKPVSDADRLLSVETVNQFISFNFPLAPLAKVGVEIVASAETFWQAIITSMREEELMFSVEKIRPKPSAQGIEKHARIRAIVGPLAQEGRLYVRDDLWNREDSLGKEFREFDRGDDDLLDALSYAILRAPKWVEGQNPSPYVAVDPAFTANAQSNHTALVCGCWVRDCFYVIDAHRFKAQKTEVIIGQIFKMALKYLEGTGNSEPNSGVSSHGFTSPGNTRGRHRAPEVKWNMPRTIDSIGESGETSVEKGQFYGHQRSKKRFGGFRH